MSFRAKMAFLLALIMLSPLFSAETSFTDINFKTMISATASNFDVVATVTYFNASYFHKLDTAAVEAEQKTKNGTPVPGVYSQDAFNASVRPLNGSPVYFTYNGFNITDGTNTICNPAMTDTGGKVSCHVEYFNNSSGQSERIINQTSCGSLMLFVPVQWRGSDQYQSSSKIIAVCPDGASALSAISPAIMNSILQGNNLLVCFPLFLIAGLLIASMYYSGRDPLSLFDITTPRLPKAPEYRVRGGSSPQMIRSIQRKLNYMQMLAKKNSLRLIDMLVMDRSMRRRAKGEIEQLFRDMLREMNLRKAEGMTESKIANYEQRLKEIIAKYSGVNMERITADQSNEVGKVLRMMSDLQQKYIINLQALEAMGASRGRMGKGNWMTRTVVDPNMKRFWRGMERVENTRVMRAVEKIPVIGGVATLPGRVADATFQYIGSRRGIRSIIRQKRGQSIYTLMNMTKTYAGVKRAFVKDADSKNKTLLGKVAFQLAGFDWENYEKLHNLDKKKLKNFDLRAEHERLRMIDLFNRQYDETEAKLLRYYIKLRGNSVEEFERALSALSAGANQRQKELIKLIKDDLGRKDFKTDAEFNAYKSTLERRLDTLATSIGGGIAPGFRDRVKDALDNEMKVRGILFTRSESFGGTDTKRLRTDMLVDLIDLAGRKTNDATHRTELRAYLDGIRMHLREYERQLRDSAMVRIEKGQYVAISKEELSNDYVRMSKADLQLKYGAALTRDLVSGEQLRNLAGAKTNKEARDILTAMLATPGITAGTVGHINSALGALGSKDNKRMSESAGKAVRDAISGITNVQLAAFDARERTMINRIIGATQADARWYTDMQGNLTRFSDSVTFRTRSADTMDDLARKINTTGQSPLAAYFRAYLEQQFIAHGAGATARDRAVANDVLNALTGRDRTTGFINSLEMLYNTRENMGGGRARAGGPTWDSLCRLMGVNPNDNSRSEALFKNLLQNSIAFTSKWSSMNNSAGGIAHGSRDEANKYFADFRSAREVLSSGAIDKNMWRALLERPSNRLEMGFAEYATTIERGLHLARVVEELQGFVASRRWRGSSRGESVLGGAFAAERQLDLSNNVMKAVYLNLINNKSVFYDEAFSTRMNGSTAFNAEAYKALLDRGYTWLDRRNGMGTLHDGNRATLPYMEYDRRFMRPGQDIIVLKKEFNNGRGDIRDLGGIVARMLSSQYADRPTGISYLIQDKATGAWYHGDPMKAANAAYAAGTRQLNLAQAVSEAAVGVTRDGNRNPSFDPTKAQIRVISTKDLVSYSKDSSYSNFFGNYGGMALFREQLRSMSYKLHEAYATRVYGTYFERTQRMNSWMSLQLQVRMDLQRTEAWANDLRITGKERYNIGALRDMENEIKAANAGRAGSQRLSSKEISDVIERINNEATRASDTSFKTQFRKNVAASVIKEIGNAESSLYSARRANEVLGKLSASDLGITREQYNALRQIYADQERHYKQAYNDSRDQYMTMNKILTTWAGSHGNYYSQKRSIFHRLPIFYSWMDSKLVQGQKEDAFNVLESGYMRDPRTAQGAGSPGFDYSIYVGYHTGQNQYERGHLYSINAPWERRMQPMLNIANRVNLWWNDKMSYLGRAMTGYPGVDSGSLMYGPDFINPERSSPSMRLIFGRSGTYSQMKSHFLQSAVDYSGLGTVLGSLKASRQSKTDFLQRQLESTLMESSHYFGNPGRINKMWRYIDEGMNITKYMKKYGNDDDHLIQVNLPGAAAPQRMTLYEAQKNLSAAATAGNEPEMQAYSSALAKDIMKNVKLRDPTPYYVRMVYSGPDIALYGAKNRFQVDLYSPFHQNTYVGIPGLFGMNPFDTEWHTFPMHAREADSSARNTRLGTVRTNYALGLQENLDGTFRAVSSDRLSTHLDAHADFYKRETTSLLHGMKLAHQEITYSPINTYSTFFVNPLLYYLYSTVGTKALSNTPFASTKRTTGGMVFTDNAVLDANVRANTGVGIEDVSPSARPRIPIPANDIYERQSGFGWLTPKGAAQACEDLVGKLAPHSTYLQRLEQKRSKMKTGDKTNKKYQEQTASEVAEYLSFIND